MIEQIVGMETHLIQKIDELLKVNVLRFSLSSEMIMKIKEKKKFISSLI